MTSIKRATMFHGLFMTLAGLQLSGYQWAGNICIFISWVMFPGGLLILIGLFSRFGVNFADMTPEVLNEKHLPPSLYLIYVLFFAAQAMFFLAAIWLLYFTAVDCVIKEKNKFVEQRRQDALPSSRR